MKKRLRKQLISNLFWTFREMWRYSRSLTIALSTSVLIRSTLPAGLALASRGLINELVVVVEQNSEDSSKLVWWIIAALVMVLLESGSNIWQVYVQLRVTDEIRLRTALSVMQHTSRFSIEQMESPAFQDLVERARMNMIKGVSAVMSTTQSITTSALQTISLVLVLAWIEPLTLLVAVVLVVPYTWFQWNLAKKRYEVEHTRTNKRRWQTYFLRILLLYEYLPEIKLFQLTPYLIRKYHELLSEFVDQDQKHYWANMIGGLVFIATAVVMMAGLLLRIIQRVLTGVLSVGDVVVFVGSVGRLSSSLQATIRSSGALQEQLRFITDLREMLAIAPTEESQASDYALSATPQPITLKHVSFSYDGVDRDTLRDISLTINAGEIVALVGENGAGKTTLIKLLAGLYQPSMGSIYYGDTDLKDISTAQWHKAISFVFQQFNRYETTAKENIAYGNWEKMLGDEDAIRKIATQSGADEIIQKMPDGYDTMLGLGFGEYKPSDGQWQKIAVARAFAREDSKILILDEPTAHFDARAEYELLEQFKALAKGRTTIIVSHRFSSLKLVDRIFCLNQGQLVEVGTHDELMTKNGYYASLYNLQKLDL